MPSLPPAHVVFLILLLPLSLVIVFNIVKVVPIVLVIAAGEEGLQETNVAGISSQHGNHAAGNTAATAALEAQLHAAEQQIQELQSQLHHKDMRVANAEAAQRSAESERDAVAQETAKLEEQVSKHQQVRMLVTSVC